MKKTIIGFTGEIGCGKDTATEYIYKKLGGRKFKFSQVLRDLLTRLSIEHSRENIQTMSTALRQGFGQDILAKIMKNDVDSSTEQYLLIDGVRRNDDIIYLRQLPEFKLVYIETDLETRYQRVIRRGENSDDIGKTFDQFKLEQEFEAEIQIRGLKNGADFVIDNNGSFEDLYAQIDKILDN